MIQRIKKAKNFLLSQIITHLQTKRSNPVHQKKGMKKPHSQRRECGFQNTYDKK